MQPYLQRVTAGTQENAYVSVLDGHEIVFIARNGSTVSKISSILLGSSNNSLINSLIRLFESEAVLLAK